MAPPDRGIQTRTEDAKVAAGKAAPRGAWLASSLHEIPTTAPIAAPNDASGPSLDICDGGLAVTSLLRP